MIGILIAILVAALVYALCLALGLPAIVGIIAAILVLLERDRHRRLRLRREVRWPRQDLTPAAGAYAARADDGVLERVSLPRAAARAFSQFRAHDMTDHAAALTYYSMMSLFPMLLVAISLLGLFGQAVDRHRRRRLPRPPRRRPDDAGHASARR